MNKAMGNPACNARHNKTVACAGIYLPSEGCCERHAMLFDIWTADFGGWRVYAFTAGGEAGPTPTSGATNPEGLRRWKRAQYHKWLDTLTPARVEQLLKMQ